MIDTANLTKIKEGAYRGNGNRLYFEYEDIIQTISFWSDKYDINENTIRTRFAENWSVERLLCKTNEDYENLIKNKEFIYNGKNIKLKQLAKSLKISLHDAYIMLTNSDDKIPKNQLYKGFTRSEMNICLEWKRLNDIFYKLWIIK